MALALLARACGHGEGCCVGVVAGVVVVDVVAMAFAVAVVSWLVVAAVVLAMNSPLL